MDTNSIVSTSQATPYPFGVSSDGVATTLRMIADRIDSGHITPQQVRLLQRHSVADFAFQTFIVQFCEKRVE